MKDIKNRKNYCSRVMLLQISILCCCVQHGMTEILLCSDFLVSGFNGVNDKAFSASNFIDGSSKYHGPRMARLYNPGDDLATPIEVGGWVCGVRDTQQYIQVTFPMNTTIATVTVQGRYKTYSQWVKSYYLQHSVDGVTWTMVTSQDGSPRLFPGSVDNNTPVTSVVTPNVTARHLRINPQSWESYIALRFDVSGCQVRKGSDGHPSKFARKSVNLTQKMVDSHTVIHAMAAVPSWKDCALTCHHHRTCVAFSYLSTNGIQWCTGYSAWIVAPGQFTSNVQVFVNQDILDTYGFKYDEGASILYTIIDIRKDQAGASTTCTTRYTQLMRVDSVSQLTSLQNVVNGSYVLRHDYRFYVSGEYVSDTWTYSGESDEIHSALWSTGNPDPEKGQCVMLTQEGLTSINCDESLFSICGN